MRKHVGEHRPWLRYVKPWECFQTYAPTDTIEDLRGFPSFPERQLG